MRLLFQSTQRLGALVKRKTTKSDIGNIIFDAERAVGADTLQAVGHMVILWNAIEATLDAALAYGAMMPIPLWTSIRSRISGLEAKADILKESLTPVMKFNEEQRALLADTLADFMTLKGYRDSLVHVRLVSSSYTGKGKVMAFGPDKRGARYEVLFSKKLLSGVLSRMRLFRREMKALDLLVSMRVLALSSQKLSSICGETPERVREIIEIKAQADWKSLRANRKRRLALRPLPEFPEEELSPDQAAATIQDNWRLFSADDAPTPRKKRKRARQRGRER